MSHPRPLRRSVRDRYIGGVCGGIAEFLGLDPTLVRVLYVLVSFFTVLPGPLAYIVLWIVIPEDDY